MMGFSSWRLYRPDGADSERIRSLCAREFLKSFRKDDHTVIITVSKDGLFVTLVEGV
jgi:hypothetical protein